MTLALVRTLLVLAWVGGSALLAQQPAVATGNSARSGLQDSLEAVEQRLTNAIAALRDATKDLVARGRLEQELVAWQTQRRLPVSAPDLVQDHLARVGKIRSEQLQKLQMERGRAKDAGQREILDRAVQQLLGEMATKDLLWKLGSTVAAGKGSFAFEGSSLVKREASGDPELLPLADGALPRYYRIRIEATRTSDQPGQRLLFPYPDPNGLGIVFGAVALGSGMHGEGSAFVWQAGPQGTGQRNAALGRLEKGQSTSFVFEQDGVAMRLYEGDTLLAELPIGSKFELPKEWSGRLASGSGAYLQVAAVSGLRIDRLECQELSADAVKAVEAAAKKAAAAAGLLATGSGWIADWNDPRNFRSGLADSCVVESSSPTQAVLKIVCCNGAVFRVTLQLKGGIVTDVGVVHLRTDKGKKGKNVEDAKGVGQITREGGKVEFQWKVDTGWESCVLTLTPKK